MDAITQQRRLHYIGRSRPQIKTQKGASLLEMTGNQPGQVNAILLKLNQLSP